MRNFNIMAAVAVALLAGGVAAAAEEQPAQPKTKKICRVEENSESRIGTRRICKTIVLREQPARSEREESADRTDESNSSSN
ncbi:MAG: hypothetical protein QOJ27_742 [Sphingomonadales bacterium]|jgi:hypothetical protein|nr:hypothetical protein [Sphingomonadales bacterium]